MSTASHVPYTWDEIATQVKRNVLAMADILCLFGPYSKELLDLFLGCDTAEIMPDDVTDEQFAAIDVSNHGIYQLTRKAYLYAYQLDGAEEVTGDDWYEVTGLLEVGYTQIDRHGEPAPLYARWDQPLRRVIETFSARWGLNNHGNGMSVRQLSLLANMSAQAVRNSLSKEGYKLELKVSDDDQSFELPAPDALTWLSKRRGYIPNRLGIRMDDPSIAVTETLGRTEIGFSEMLERLMKITGKSSTDIVEATGAAHEWVNQLIAGQPVDINLQAFVAVGKALGADPAKFAGRAVEHYLAGNID